MLRGGCGVAMSIFDNIRAARISAARIYRGGKGKLYAGLTVMSGINSFVPQSLKIAPHDLGTADPEIAREFYNGRYNLGGEVVEAVQDNNPFQFESENQNWLKELHSFSWLLHFSANSDAVSDSLARTLVVDWMQIDPANGAKCIWETQTTARRLISLLCHSPVLLSKPDADFHYLLMRSLGKHIKVLKRQLVDSPDGIHVLLAHIALSYASVTFEGTTSPLKPFNEKLSITLKNQILPDGGHISRNPACIPDILALLLSLRQSFIATDQQPPQELVSAIERMFPALRYFRHGDGSLARFNGCSVSRSDLISTLLRYDEAMGSPLRDASHSGYQMAQVEDAKLIMDTGMPPQGELSMEAHSGILSFEFSKAGNTLIINCGRPEFPQKDTSQVWRTTNAHSTATLNDTSIARFENPGSAGRAITGQIFPRSFKLETSRTDKEDGSIIMGAHEGYVREFGIRHQRTLTLDKNGNRLYGQEWFSGPDKSDMRYTTRDMVAIRFHLHPSIKASISSNGETCLLETSNGERWRFDCPGFKLELTESIFFAALPRPRPTWQIVIETKVYDHPEINWALQKIQDAESP